MRGGDFYSLLRRGFIGRFADGYVIATLMDATGIWPGLLARVNAHILLFACGAAVISVVSDLVHKGTRPKPPPCTTVEPELDLGDDEK